MFDIDEVMEDLEISYSKIEVIKQMGKYKVVTYLGLCIYLVFIGE